MPERSSRRSEELGLGPAEIRHVGLEEDALLHHLLVGDDLWVLERGLVAQEVGLLEGIAIVAKAVAAC